MSNQPPRKPGAKSGLLGGTYLGGVPFNPVSSNWSARSAPTQAPTSEEIKQSFLTVIDATQALTNTLLTKHNKLYETIQISKSFLQEAGLMSTTEADESLRIGAFIHKMNKHNPEFSLRDMKRRIEALPTNGTKARSHIVNSTRDEFYSLMELPFMEPFIPNKDTLLSEEATKAYALESALVSNIVVRAQKLSMRMASEEMDGVLIPELRHLQKITVLLQQELFSKDVEEIAAKKSFSEAVSNFGRIIGQVANSTRSPIR
jgi:hypothetical protein